MFNTDYRRCYTVGEGTRLQEYLLREYVYVDAEQLDEVGKEEELKFHKVREELTETQFNNLYSKRIGDLKTMLDDMPYIPDIDYELVKTILDKDRDKLDKIIGAELTNWERVELVRHGTRMAINQDIQHAINNSEDFSEVVDYLERLGHTVRIQGGSIIVDKKDGDLKELHKTNHETLESFSVSAVCRAIDERIAKEDPENVPQLDKYKEAKHNEINRQKRIAASQNGAYFYSGNGHIYKTNVKWQIMTNSYGKTTYVKRSQMEQLFVKIFMRDRHAEEEAQKRIEQSAKVQKFERLEAIEQERMDSIFRLAQNYGIASEESAKRLRDELTEKLAQGQTVQMSASTRLHKSERITSEMQRAKNDYDRVDWKKLGFRKEEDFRKYVNRFQNPETLVHYELQKQMELQEQIRNIKEYNAVYRKDINDITKNFIPYINSEFYDEVKLRGYKKEYDKALRKEREAARKENLFTKPLEDETKPSDDIRQLIKDNGTKREVLEKELQELEAKKNRMVKIQKCDPDLVVTRNITSGDAHDAVKEFYQNRIDHGRPAPGIDTPAPAANGNGNARFAQQFVISPSPEDNVSPSQMKAFVEDFYDRSKVLGTDYKSFAVVHVDHYTGKDPETGKVYNQERLERFGPDKNTVHAQFFVDCQSTDNVHYNKDGTWYSNPIRSWQDGANAEKKGYDTMHSLANLETELALERGWTHTVMHSPEFRERVREIPKLDLTKQEDRQKLFQTAAISGVYNIKQTENGKFEFSGRDIEGVMVIDAKNFKEAVESFSEIQADRMANADALSSIREDTIQAIRDEENHNSVVADRTETPQEAIIIQGDNPQMSLKEFWAANKDNPDVLRDRVRSDIDKVMNEAKPLSQKQFQEEMEKLGYQMITKRGITYYTPDKAASAANVPRVSERALDKINGTVLNQYNKEVLNNEFRENREQCRRESASQFVGREQREEERRRQREEEERRRREKERKKVHSRSGFHR